MKNRNETLSFNFNKTLEVNFIDEMDKIAETVQSVRMNLLASPRIVALLANRSIPDELVTEKLGLSSNLRWSIVNRILSGFLRNGRRWKGKA